ncbi:DUF4150 domain-containing protein [Candidatus Methylospira mobilis]|uniref:DUF4150 domain-containing protein n=1 Tax=Candidatus Methylospira mobilis TaxID=1808979 RepID=A0A5Q0BHP4_9GAMM|nr:DUF4150 domain-containing protein [Candidatus Methylospira mobilis]QFY41697.1 DUF4150 domain-containing protein [Candidatus Methylospira mobilis]WNV06550.1 DUF4150 domain-containing protein [Candidatus Methylospira mobilis]
MFLNSIEGGMNMCDLDVCNTTMGPVVVPIPYPNTSTNDAADPATTGMCVLFDGMPSVTVMTSLTFSMDDETGDMLGLVSHMIMGETTFLEPVPNVLIDGMPATCIMGMTGQNCLEVVLNGPGSTLAPSQTIVMAA